MVASNLKDVDMKLLALAIALVLAGQDAKVTLKFNPKKGDKLTKSQKMEMRIKAAVKAGDVDQEFEVEQKGSEKTVLEFVEVEDGKLTKLVLDCVEDFEEKKQPPSMEWNRTDKPMNGRKVTLTLKDGQVVREGVDGLDEKHQKKLTLEDSSARIFPKNPVAVGDRWEIKGEDVQKFLENDENLKDGTIKMRLVEVKEIDKRRCAVIKADLELKGKAESNVEFTIKMEADIIVWIDRGYTLSVKAKGTMTMKADTEEFSMTGDGPISLELSTKVE